MSFFSGQSWSDPKASYNNWSASKEETTTTTTPAQAVEEEDYIINHINYVQLLLGIILILSIILILIVAIGKRKPRTLYL